MINWTPRLIEARDFGRAAHAGQVRKYTGEPYWIHPEAVALTVSNYTQDEDIIIAALGHDWYEDTKVTYLKVLALFGLRVANLISELTDVYTSENYPDRPRAIRKAQEAARLATISNDSKLIKLSDLLDNTADIVKNDPKFAITYLKEKHVVMQGLVGGNPELYAVVQKQLQDCVDKLDVNL